MAAFALSRSGSRASSRGADRPASRGADRVSSREGGTSAGRQVSGAVKGGEAKPGDSHREYAGATGWFQRRAGGRSILPTPSAYRSSRIFSAHYPTAKLCPSQGDGRRGEYPLGREREWRRYLTARGRRRLPSLPQDSRDRPLSE